MPAPQSASTVQRTKHTFMGLDAPLAVHAASDPCDATSTHSAFGPALAHELVAVHVLGDVAGQLRCRAARSASL